MWTGHPNNITKQLGFQAHSNFRAKYLCILGIVLPFFFILLLSFCLSRSEVLQWWVKCLSLCLSCCCISRAHKVTTSTTHYSSSGTEFSSVQFKMIAVCSEKPRYATPSLRSFPNITFGTVPVFVWLMMALSRPFKEDCLALPLSMPLSSGWSVVWCPWPFVCR